jgi:hypothetical protein
MASFDAFFRAVEVSRVLGSGSNDVVIADHPVGLPLICLWAGYHGKGIRPAVRLALDELDPVVEFLEFDNPPGLLLSIGANCPKVFRILIICTHFDPAPNASQVVRPVLEGSHNS